MLPRTKVQIQNAWLAWLDARAVSDGLSAHQKGLLKLELAREMAWALGAVDLEADLAGRQSKYADLLLAHDGDLTDFDPWWTQRRDFLAWMQS